MSSLKKICQITEKLSGIKLYLKIKKFQVLWSSILILEKFQKLLVGNLNLIFLKDLEKTFKVMKSYYEV